MTLRFDKWDQAPYSKDNHSYHVYDKVVKVLYPRLLGGVEWVLFFMALNDTPGSFAAHYRPSRR
ncbi:hypothetical protein LNA02_20400 [Levilactobacillus namurensis]|nr:hypothetical protein LNA02_20400 [Levilactobacillus namurensis]